MNSPYFVSEFSSSNNSFSNIIKNNINVQLEEVTQKRQLKTIVSHLEKLKAITMVCENEYVDNGYFEDYLNYYVGCHETYPKYCSRIHFFTKEFDHDKFEEALLLEPKCTSGVLGEYLGFIVIKPIPMTFIGRTCLKALPQNESRYDKLINRKYKANLFGLELSVSSLAFQEQDQVVSACTSASIWCLLHGLKLKKIKSPAQITLAATEHSKIINTFPSIGLNPIEIERALEYFDLRQYTISPKGETEQDIDQLTRYIKTYIDSDIPLILGAECYSLSPNNNIYEKIGNHAVTIIGYGLSEGKLDKLIVHDDREGPYTTLNFIRNFDMGNKEKKTVLIESSQANKVGTDGHLSCKEILQYTSLIIATDPRVRINFNVISKTETKLKKLLEEHFSKVKEKDELPLVYASPSVETNTKLIRSSDYKQTIKHGTYLNKSELLTHSFPKFLWVIEFQIGNDSVFDLLFDSSSLPQGQAFICASYKQDYSENMLRNLSKDYYNLELQERSEYRFRGADFLLQVLNKLKSTKNSFFSYHDEMFGRARMPKLIKPTEISNEQLNDSQARLVLYNTKDNLSEDGGYRFNKLLAQQDIETVKLEQDEEYEVKKLIWIISEYGAVFIGKDSPQTGHPTLTGAKPARIGGEFIEKTDSPGVIYVNNFSGRYSYNFGSKGERRQLLENAMPKLISILTHPNIQFKLDPRI